MRDAESTEFNLVRLHQLVAESFNLDEIRSLCFHLHLDPENIPGETKIGKAREFVKQLYRIGNIPELLKLCRSERPNALWDSVFDVSQSGDMPLDWVDPIQQWYRLVRAFNRNRALPFSHERTLAGDEIAFEMREVAPYVFQAFDVSTWIASANVGKRLAAVKYLDWIQDIEYLDRLLKMLIVERPFVQLHVLFALDSMVDQFDPPSRKLLKAAMLAYKIARHDPSLDYWHKRISSRLNNMDAHSLPK